MMREVSLETLPNVNIRDPSHDKNLPIMSVTGSIIQKCFQIKKKKCQNLPSQVGSSNSKRFVEHLLHSVAAVVVAAATVVGVL